MAEQGPFKPRVEGSSPPGSTERVEKSNVNMNKYIVAFFVAVLVLVGCDKSGGPSDASTDLGPVDVPSACVDSGVDVFDASDADVVDSDLPEYNGCSR